MQKSGEILADVLDDGLEISGEETTIEVNFAVMKIRLRRRLCHADKPCLARCIGAV